MSLGAIVSIWMETWFLETCDSRACHYERPDFKNKTCENNSKACQLNVKLLRVWYSWVCWPFRFAKSVGRVTSEAVDGTSPAPNAKSILSFTGLQTGSHITWTHPKRITLSSIPGGTEFLPHFDWKTTWCPNSTIAKHLQGAFEFFCNQVPDVLVPPANLIQSKLQVFISICLLNTPTLRRLLLVCFNIATCSSGSIHLAVFDFRCCAVELSISILHTSVALFALLPLGAAFCQTWIFVPKRRKFFGKYWER